jgi:hypothetical protein
MVLIKWLYFYGSSYVRCQHPGKHPKEYLRPADLTSDEAVTR